MEKFDELDSSSILDGVAIKVDEPLIRKAMKKSAKELLKTSECYKDLDALKNIFEWYLYGRKKLIDEAEYRARKKVGKFWKKHKEDLDKQKEDFKMLIVKEINIAHQFEQPTSRLTVLYLKIEKPTDPMAEAKKDPRFEKFSRRAKRRIKLKVLLYKLGFKKLSDKIK